MAVLIVAILFFACRKIDLGNIQNLNDGQVMVIGHGGSGFPEFSNQLPANSWTSIERALEGLNANAVDIDVQLSADHQLILYHDGRLESQTDCYGCIPETESETIISCCYRNNFSNNITDHHAVILLEDLLEHYAESPFTFLLDLKPFGQCTEDIIVDLDTFATVLTDLVVRLKMEDRIIFNSFFVDLLAKLKALNPGFRVFKDGVNFDENFSEATTIGFNGITMSNLDIDEDQVSQAHDAGLWVILYSVKERFGTADALRKNPDGIITDNIELLQNFLD